MDEDLYNWAVITHKCHAPGELDVHMTETGILVVSFRGVNSTFWST